MTVSDVRMDSESPPDLGSWERYSLQLRADPVQFGAIRRIVSAHLRLWHHESLVAAATVCVTEMLSNVHRHVQMPECELALVHVPGGVRVSVRDLSYVLPVASEPDWCAESGRGLFLLAHTAELWGTMPTATGKTVWVLLREVS